MSFYAEQLKKKLFVFIRNVREKYNINLSLFISSSNAWLWLSGESFPKLHPAYRSNISVLIVETTRWHRLLRKHSLSEAVFFFSRLTFWIFIKNIYYQYICKSHLTNSSNIDPTEEDYQKKVFTIKMPTTRK